MRLPRRSGGLRVRLFAGRQLDDQTNNGISWRGEGGNEPRTRPEKPTGVQAMLSPAPMTFRTPMVRAKQAHRPIRMKLWRERAGGAGGIQAGPYCAGQQPGNRNSTAQIGKYIGGAGHCRRVTLLSREQVGSTQRRPARSVPRRASSWWLMVGGRKMVYRQGGLRPLQARW